MQIGDFDNFSVITGKNYCTLARARHLQSGQYCLLMSSTGILPEKILKKLFCHELAVTAKTDNSAVIAAREYIDGTVPAALVMDDFNGISLNAYREKHSENIKLTIQAAYSITSALSSIHEKGIVHRNIDSSSVFLPVPGTVEVPQAVFSFFGLSGIFESDGRLTGPELKSFHNCVSWEYASPEMTGLTYMEPDHRSDLYSLGMILYELFTGTLPFRLKDPAEIKHWHAAVQPVPPASVNSSIPGTVSDIIMVLLEKNPGNRYGSAPALLDDLKLCLEKTGKGSKNGIFTPRTGRSGNTPEFPDCIFGREREKAELDSMLDSVCLEKTAVCLVAGPPGAGKTVLVRDIIPAVEERKGWFASGKFDQYRRDIPFSAIAEVMRNLIRRMLMLSDPELASWREKIIRALRPNTRLITDIVSELEFVTGPQKKAPDTDPANAENRLNSCFCDFISLLAELRAPLVMFFDDMQWADAASLKIISRIAGTDPPPGLFIIGAYRDSEVDDSHILSKTIDHLSAADVPFSKITLSRLEPEHVTEMLFSALDSEVKDLEKFSSLVYRKTAGNPFYIREFIRALHVSGCLKRDGDGRWLADINAAAVMPATENVVSLLAATMEKIPDMQRRVLFAASCAGAVFDTDLLARSIDMNISTLRRTLLTLARQDFLVMDTGGTYGFAHDRIQESANNLYSAKDRAFLHRKIGNLLLQLTPGSDKDRIIFEIADHFNEAKSLISSDEEALHIIDLNRSAGNMARSSAAFDAAVKYFSNAISVLEKYPGLKERSLLYELHTGHAWCLYLSGSFSNAETEVHEAMKYALTTVEKTELLNILIIMKTMEQKFDEAIDCGTKALKILGIDFSGEPEERMKQINKEKIKTDFYLKNASIDTIINLPECDKEDIIQVNKILRSIGSPGYIRADKSIIMFTSLKITSLSFEYGITPHSTCGFVSYGILLSTIWKQYKISDILGEASVIISKRMNNLSQLCETMLKHGAFIRYWSGHVKNSIQYINMALDAGIKSADYIWAGYAAGHIVLNTFVIGENIQKCIELINSRINFFVKVNDLLTVDVFFVLQIVYSDLIDKIHDPDFTDIQEAPGYPSITNRKKQLTPLSVALYYLNKSLVQYICRDYLNAYEYIKKTEPISIHLFISYHAIDIIFYKSLILCVLYHDVTKKEKNIYLSEIKETHDKLEEWAEQCPENFSYRYLLLKAELARVEGDIIPAMKYYDMAIEAAKVYGYIQFEAIACEMAALFWEENGKPDFAELYLRRAFECYNCWGAARKTRQLREKYPEIFLSGENITSALNDTEVISMLEFFSTVSGQAGFDDLLREFSRIILQTTGAGSFIIHMDYGDRTFTVKSAVTGDMDNPGVISIPVDAGLWENEEEFPAEIIRYVKRTDEQIMLYDSEMDTWFGRTLYIKKTRPLSAMCIKTGVSGGNLVFYLENRLLRGAFGNVNKTLVEVMGRHGSICLENGLYRTGRWEVTAMNNFVFKCEDETLTLSFENIVYFSSRGRRSVIHTADSSFNTNMLLKDIEKNMPVDMFIRIHKQYIINMKYISRIKNRGSGRSLIHLNDEEDTWLPVGRGYHIGLLGKIKKKIPVYQY